MAASDPDPGSVQLSAYRALLDNARAMLKAAREERWDDLADLDGDRVRCLSDVKQADLVSTRPADIAAQTELIQGILDCDELTKSLVHAWREELGAMLGSMDNARKLSDVYRTG